MTEKILLVDDEAGIRKVLGIALADMGYTVFIAENGKRALEIFKDKRPAIVLTDIQMPVMDGVTLLEQIKRVDPEAEVILFTGHGDMDIAVKSLKYDATDFIIKPIDVKLLRIALNRAKERYTLRQRLREYTENLEQLVADKTGQLIAAERLAAAGQVVTGLSHTIKHIATSLKGSIYVLENATGQNDSDLLQQGLMMVKGNVEKIANLSMDMLNYGRYAGLNCRATDPGMPVRAVSDLMKPRAAAHGIVLNTDISKDLNPVSMDAEGIHCCLLNLVANAVDACLAVDDKREKTIDMHALPQGKEGVAYRVTDNGCGMNEAARRKVFSEIFSTKGSQGTGLGLKMTKNIVDLHDGEIEFFSEENKGSTFIISLFPGSGRS